MLVMPGLYLHVRSLWLIQPAFTRPVSPESVFGLVVLDPVTVGNMKHAVLHFILFLQSATPILHVWHLFFTIKAGTEQNCCSSLSSYRLLMIISSGLQETVLTCQAKSMSTQYLRNTCIKRKKKQSKLEEQELQRLYFAVGQMPSRVNGGWILLSRWLLVQPK